MNFPSEAQVLVLARLVWEHSRRFGCGAIHVPGRHWCAGAASHRPGGAIEAGITHAG
jgi:hypothetical protein